MIGPLVTTATQAPPRTVTHTDGRRLVMYRQAADTPEFWDRHWASDPPRRLSRATIERRLRGPFERFLPRDGLIVEAGCGNGNLARTMFNSGFLVEGLDFAPRVIDANRAIDPAGRYRVGDVRSMPYDDNALAGYVSMGVVEHFNDVDRELILDEAKRCLRPGGVAIISTPHYSPLRRLRAAFGGYAKPDEARDLPFYQYLFTGAELRRMVRRAGLDVLHTDTYDAYKGLKDTIGGKRLLDRLRAQGGIVERLVDHPPALFRALCSHMVLVVARKPSPAQADAALPDRSRAA